MAAGLSTRKYLEKYLSIYVMCGGVLPARPDQHTIYLFKQEIKTVLRVWNVYTSELTRKRTIISINLILLTCLYRVMGQRGYDMYCRELTVTRMEMFRSLGLFMRLMVPHWGAFPVPMRLLPARTL